MAADDMSEGAAAILGVQAVDGAGSKGEWEYRKVHAGPVSFEDVPAGASRITVEGMRRREFSRVPIRDQRAVV